MSTDPEQPPGPPPEGDPTPSQSPPPSAPPPAAGPPANEKKLIAGILAILLGALGIHKFYLGYQKEGIILLVATLVVGGITCGFGVSVTAIFGLVEGIIYLTKTDEEFERTYVTGRKPWL